MSGDHNANQKLGSNDLVECGTCGYPLLPEERTGLVEVEGKMVKPWVGLTDEDIEEVWGEPVGFMYGRYYDAIRALEERLREKNT